SLNHPNIASVYGIEEADGLCGIVLELIEGESLSDRTRLGPVATGQALGFARQIVAGLQAAHAKGIIHRDLKPSNIKITKDRTIKIVDFGLAKLLDYSIRGEEGASDGSMRSAVVGTLAFMSPEQARGKSVDARTDIWAFGCVLYEMLVGKPAFHGDTPTDTIVKIATEDPDWSLLPTLPPAIAGVEPIIRRCIQKNPDSRYQSVQEIVSALDGMQKQKAAAELPASVSQTAGTDEDFILPGRSAPALFMLAQVGYLAL